MQHRAALKTSVDLVSALRIVLAMILAIAALVVVLQLRLGPVVATIAPGRGIHSGDSLGLLAALGSLRLLWISASEQRVVARHVVSG